MGLDRLLCLADGVLYARSSSDSIHTLKVCECGHTDKQVQSVCNLSWVMPSLLQTITMKIIRQCCDCVKPISQSI